MAFLKGTPANRLSLCNEDPFKVRLLIFAKRQCWNLLESRVCAEKVIDCGKVFEVVGGDVDSALWKQGSVYGVEEPGGEEAAAMMTAFWPRIGEEDIECGDGLVGDQVVEDVGYFEPEKANIAHAGPYCLPFDAVKASGLPVDSKVACIRVGARPGEEETTFAATNIDLQWHLSVEQAFAGQCVGKRRGADEE